MTVDEMESAIRKHDQYTKAMEQILPTLATKQDLAEMKAGLETKFATKADLAEAIAPLATKIEVREEGARTRRHFDVVAESLEGSIKLVAEGLLALGQQMTKLEANLKAGFETRIRTTELALQDHARRLIALETRNS